MPASIEHPELAITWLDWGRSDQLTSAPRRGQAASQAVEAMSGPRSMLVNDCVATAPTPGSTQGTIAPTAGQRVATAAAELAGSPGHAQGS